MDHWKQVLVAGAFGASAVLFMKGRRPAGVIAAGIGLATLASEYPEYFEKLRRELPNYVDRGTQFLDLVSRFGDRLADAVESRGESLFEGLRS